MATRRPVAIAIPTDPDEDLFESLYYTPRLVYTWRLLIFDYGRRLTLSEDSNIEKERPPMWKGRMVVGAVGNSNLWILL